MPAEPTKKHLTIAWIGVAIFAIIVGISSSIPVVSDLTIKLFARCWGYGVAFLISYLFFWYIVFRKCPKVKKKILLSISGVIIVIIGYIYTPIIVNNIVNSSGTVHMKEDVLYIHPQTDANDFNPDSLFDGSKNDPNLKPDTEVILIKRANN
jgi:hypothetical protein